MTINFEKTLGDYKRNEQEVMAELDKVAKGASKTNKKGGDQSGAVAATEEIRTWTEHTWERSKLIETYQTDRENGLNDEKLKQLLQKYGDNALTEKPSTPWYIMLAKEFTGFFSLLLIFGGVLCFIGYGMDQSTSDNLFLGCVLIFVVTVTSIFSWTQESKAASLMAEFKNFTPESAKVIRNGKNVQVPAKELVPGDIVRVKIGENIPADIILFEASELKVNNASLTGESEDIFKKPDAFKANVFESDNCVFFGTSCTAGEGLGMVFKTGDKTVMGRIAGLASSADAEETTLNRDIRKFITIISAIAITLGITFFILGLAIGYELITGVIFAIGIIVANVPEGLLVTVTVALALTARRMSQKFVQVNNMESVETLGSTSCICSDKTGTLTQNRMTVSQMFIAGDIIDATVNFEIYNLLKEKKAKGETVDIKEPSYKTSDNLFRTFVETITLGTICYFAYQPDQDQVKKIVSKKAKVPFAKLPKGKLECVGDFKHLEKHWQDAEKEMIEIEEKKAYIKRSTEGDASETGLIKFVQPLMMDDCYKQGGISGYRESHPLVQDDKKQLVQIPFNSNNKFNVLVRDMNPKDTSPDSINNNMTVYLKGAPERVVNRCSTYLKTADGNGNCTEEKLDKTMLNLIDAANKKFGGSGERVLAFARKQLDPKVYVKSSHGFDVKGWESWGKEKPTEPNAVPTGSFPMWNLQLVGVVSLNDPPRPQVDISVKTCKKAGIKVIMVTGDQPPTAAAIAHQVNIIESPDKEYNALVQKGMSEEQAMAECHSIVIHGDELAKINREEEALDDNEIEKGRRIMDWISKPEVVFARTTPEQKLLIVNACQKLGHVVAVTGDGVNDSPAIKKANIGVAMGSGSRVAKDAADMIILNDDFSSIVNGIEEGRLIFDNLKKSIAYTLTSNIPEICPFIAFILFQVPLPLTTVLILCIDLGTDMIPAIAFAYEHAELDIMNRLPRNPKLDQLVGKKMISWSYLQVGMIQQFGAFFTYFYVMNDYGIRPGTLFYLDPEEGYYPKASDVYNPNQVGYGNTNYGNDEYKGKMNWLKKNYGDIDIRLFYTSRPADAWSKCRWDDETSPKFYRISPETNKQICYTTESLKYAHTAYLVAIVCLQWADGVSAKTRTLSMGQQGFSNTMGNVGFVSETVLIIFITYIPVFNWIFETRMVAFPHLGVPVWPWVTVLWLYDEMRKFFVRRNPELLPSGQKKFTSWTARNTYY